MKWRDQSRRAQSRRRLKFFVLTAGLYLIWVGLVWLVWWSWVEVFHRTPPPHLVLWVFMFVGIVLVTLFTRYGPALPFRGSSPEEGAAKAFFSGEDVRSDDHRFEEDLRP